MIVVLIGYMGSGKSTIGKELATILNRVFLDLDDYISDKENLSIPELFQTKGEIYFRKKETQYLKDLVQNQDNVVLALGGGTPCYGENMSVLLSETKVKLFYLKLSIPILVERLYKERDTRPLISHISSKEDLQEFIGKHLFERSPCYNQAAYTIKADAKSQKDVLEDILMKLI